MTHRARERAKVFVFIEVVLGYTWEDGRGRRAVPGGPVHWVRERRDVVSRAWGGEIEASATCACGLSNTGMVSDRRTADAITCHECQVLYAAEALRRDACPRCDGAGMLPSTARPAGLFECSACGGTGFA